MKWKERLQTDNRLAGIGILVAGVLIWFLCTRIGYWIILAFAVFLILALLLPPMWCKLVEKIRRYRKTKAFGRDLENNLKEALKIMDSVGGSYASEREANKELVCILRAKGVDAVYEPSEEGSRPDILIVGENIFIEGKLDIEAADKVDRLVGQIAKYSTNRSCSALAVTIYGQCDKNKKDWIKNNLEKSFEKRSALVHLENPKRLKKEPSRAKVIEIREHD